MSSIVTVSIIVVVLPRVYFRRQSPCFSTETITSHVTTDGLPWGDGGGGGGGVKLGEGGCGYMNTRQAVRSLDHVTGCACCYSLRKEV